MYPLALFYWIYADGDRAGAANWRTAAIAPHLTHRVLIERINIPTITADLIEFKSILLNLRHPGGRRKRENREFSASLLSQLKSLELFQLSYQQDDVYLFTRLDQP
nr:hypothetical protein [Leptolyngbya sp. FACHB-541]